MAQRTKQTAARGRAAPGSSRNGRAGRAGRRAGGETGRQAEVLALAGDLFARNGYAATTVRDIADAAGILSGSLYHHFASKEAMADEILRSFLDEILGVYDEIHDSGLPPRARFEALANVSLAAMERHQAAIVIYQNDGRLLAGLERFSYLRRAGQRFEQAWVDVLEEGIDSGDFRASVEPELAYRFVRATLWTVARWYRPGGDLTPQQISDQYLSIMLDGIAKAKKKKARG
jgi:AcrR family transcriptional regulator